MTHVPLLVTCILITLILIMMCPKFSTLYCCSPPLQQISNPWKAPLCKIVPVSVPDAAPRMILAELSSTVRAAHPLQLPVSTQGPAVNTRPPPCPHFLCVFSVSVNGVLSTVCWVLLQAFSVGCPGHRGERLFPWLPGASAVTPNPSAGRSPHGATLSPGETHG